MHAVRPADADVVAVALRPLDDRVLRALEPCEQQLAGVADLQRERRVDDVGGGQAVVDPASRRADLLRHRVDEGGEVVLRLALELGDPLGARRLDPLADLGNRVGGDGAELGPGLEGGELDVQPARELALLRPDPVHLGSGVARNHRLECRARAGGPPGTKSHAFGTPPSHIRAHCLRHPGYPRVGGG